MHVKMARMGAIYFLGSLTTVGKGYLFQPMYSQAVLKRTALRSMSAMHVETSGPSVDDPNDVEEEVTELSKLDIRVGHILEVQKHPSLDKIFVQKIDLNEDSGPRTICSGLQGFVKDSELVGANCIVLCNLKPRELDGVPSDGMVLCASNLEHTEVQLVTPPTGTPVGEQIRFPGHILDPAPVGNRAAKSLKKVGKYFRTDESGTAVFTGEPLSIFSTSLGPCTSSMKEASIS